MSDLAKAIAALRTLQESPFAASIYRNGVEQLARMEREIKMPKDFKGGRPRHGLSVKREPLNMRASPELRARIEEAALASGLSLSQEVERRLIASFDRDDMRRIIREELGRDAPAAG